MKRSAPMKRSGLERAAPERRPVPPLTPIPLDLRGRVIPARISVEPLTIAKVRPVRHEGYRRLVAALPCDLCGRVGRSQAAHPNTGKGAGLKADDRLCFPLCAPGLYGIGCHAAFDQHALMTKAQRREYEPAAAARTQALIRNAGQWPKDLPPLSG